MRRFLRLLLWAVFVPAVIVAGYLGATLAGALIPARGGLQLAAGKPEKIFLLTSLLHADFAIAVDDALRARFSFLREAGVPVDHPNLRYLVFGWGAREFYINTPTLADVAPLPLFKGITGDRSVMHVMAAADVSRAESSIALTLPPGGREKLVEFIAASFTRKGNATLPIPGVSYGMSDAFFEGEGGFHIFKPCNIWVAQGLRQAGLATGAWTPTTWSLKLGLSLHSPQALAR